MRLVEVAIDIPAKSLDDSYTYELPDEPAFTDAEVGCAVQVSFGPRKAIGFIVGIIEVDASCGQGEVPAKLKPIEAVLTKSYFDELGAKCARFLARRYVAPLSVCVRLLTPPGAVPRVVKSGAGWRVEAPQIGEVDDRWITLGPEGESFRPKRNATKQIAVMDAVRQGDIKVSELNALYGSVASAVNALQKRGAIHVERRRRMRDDDLRRAGRSDHDPDGMDDASKARSSYHVVEFPCSLTPGQERALLAISDAYEAHDGEVVLIDGVTGSGKTEVYLQAIKRALDDGCSAIVLVPEISLTPQTVARFRGRFGDTVAVLHSRMSAGERYDQWDLIRAGKAKVVVGARSALFAPLQNLGLIVIDEEHETTYKQESSPRYVTRDVAEWMMRMRGGTLVLGSATPSVESLHKANTHEGWRVTEMPERANGHAMPEIEIIDMASEFRSGEREMFSARLRHAMVEELTQGHKVVLLLNQRGFAQFLLCRDCGFVPRCTSCSTSLTYHARGNVLVCHHCGYTIASPPTCPSCGSPYLRKFGVGTQRVEDELRAFLDEEFAGMPQSGSDAALSSEGSSIPVIRMDADTTSKKGAHRHLLEEFAVAPRGVLLGTQMIAKGLDFDEVTLVGVVNADTQLHLPDFRASERTFDLIEQVAGRAGRGDLPGRVMIQTYVPDDVAIRAAASYDRNLFLRSELPKRRVLRYPPYVRMANVLIWGSDSSKVRDAAMDLHDRLEASLIEIGGASPAAIGDSSSAWEILPAAPCVFERIRNDYRWHVIVKAPADTDISEFLYSVYRDLKTLPHVNVAFDLDPVDLL